MCILSKLLADCITSNQLSGFDSHTIIHDFGHPSISFLVDFCSMMNSLTLGCETRNLTWLVVSILLKNFSMCNMAKTYFLHVTIFQFIILQCLTKEIHWLCHSLFIFLCQDNNNTSISSICIKDKILKVIWIDKCWGTTIFLLDLAKDLFSFYCPLEYCILLEFEIDMPNQTCKVRNESPNKVDFTKKWLQSFFVS